MQGSVNGTPYIKNYEFEYSFPPPWRESIVVMTSVSGHINTTDFEGRYRVWTACPPGHLFDAPIVTAPHEVNPSGPLGMPCAKRVL